MRNEKREAIHYPEQRFILVNKLRYYNWRTTVEKAPYKLTLINHSLAFQFFLNNLKGRLSCQKWLSVLADILNLILIGLMIDYNLKNGKSQGLPMSDLYRNIIYCKCESRCQTDVPYVDDLTFRRLGTKRIKLKQKFLLKFVVHLV